MYIYIYIYIGENALSAEDQHLVDWLNSIDGDMMTEVMLQSCDREELMCLLYLCSGLMPTSRIPSRLASGIV